REAERPPQGGGLLLARLIQRVEVAKELPAQRSELQDHGNRARASRVIDSDRRARVLEQRIKTRFGKRQAHRNGQVPAFFRSYDRLPGQAAGWEFQVMEGKCSRDVRPGGTEEVVLGRHRSVGVEDKRQQRVHFGIGKQRADPVAERIPLPPKRRARQFLQVVGKLQGRRKTLAASGQHLLKVPLDAGKGLLRNAAPVSANKDRSLHRLMVTKAKIQRIEMVLRKDGADGFEIGALDLQGGFAQLHRGIHPDRSLELEPPYFRFAAQEGQRQKENKNTPLQHLNFVPF